LPELPDVETFTRYLQATSLHQQIVDAEVQAPRMLQGVSAGELVRRLKGHAFESVCRRGKYLFAELDGNGWLVLHFGMTGYLDYGKAKNEPQEHCRLTIRFENGYRLAGMWRRRLGRIGLAETPGAFVEKEELGPDAYDPGIPLAEFKEMLRNRRGSIKTALMDQRFIAGLGNIYSDEILFQAHIHPRTEIRQLSDRDLDTLHRKIRHVLEMSIERQADPQHLPNSWLLPHRSEGETCPSCGGSLKKEKVAGRTAYICPHCQTVPR
jgi:formamidopyrimidine-DNA glycosylase